MDRVINEFGGQPLPPVPQQLGALGCVGGRTGFVVFVFPSANVLVDV